MRKIFNRIPVVLLLNLSETLQTLSGIGEEDHACKICFPEQTGAKKTGRGDDEILARTRDDSQQKRKKEALSMPKNGGMAFKTMQGVPFGYMEVLYYLE